MPIIHRRAFLTGLGASLFAAPAIVRAASLMPIKAVKLFNNEELRLEVIKLWNDCDRIIIDSLTEFNEQILKTYMAPERYLHAK